MDLYQEQTGYTEKELSDAFNMVKDDEHWKNPISKTLHNVSFEQLVVVKKAVQFYTATEAKVQLFKITGPETVNARVSADGYRVGPAGDH